MNRKEGSLFRRVIFPRGHYYELRGRVLSRRGITSTKEELPEILKKKKKKGRYSEKKTIRVDIQQNKKRKEQNRGDIPKRKKCPRVRVGNSY